MVKRKKMEKKIYHANINHRKARMVILMSDKVDFRSKKITRDREEHLSLSYVKRVNPPGRHNNLKWACTKQHT